MDMEGNVVGMNTALISSSGSFAGVGFAIPIDTVRAHFLHCHENTDGASHNI